MYTLLWYKILGKENYFLKFAKDDLILAFEI
jgi:hypothetical protein